MKLANRHTQIEMHRTGGFTSAFKKNIGPWLLILPSVILFYFIVWRPVGAGIYLSFFEIQGYTPVEFVGLENYKRILTDTQFLKVLANTFKYVFWSLTIGYLPPIIFALMINEVIHMRGYVKFAIYFPAILPAVATSMIWYLFYYPNASGVFNTILLKLGLETQQWLQDPDMTIVYIVISMVWNGFGSTTIMYLASLQGVNKELYEAAMLDGAGIFRRIRLIAIPRIKGVMLLFFVRQIISVFQVMEQPLTMTGGGPNGASLSLGLQGYRYAFEYFKIDSAMANNVIMFLILMVLTVFYFFLERKVDNDE